MSIIEKALDRIQDKELERKPGTAPQQPPADVPAPDILTPDPEASFRPEPAAGGQPAPAQKPTAKARPAAKAPPKPVSETVSLDLAALRRMGILTPDSTNKTLLEEYRRIKRPVLERAFGAGAAEGSNLVMVTSSLAEEGKTFTSLNLALSIAREFDNTVLLVDADVVKRSLSRHLNLLARPGLTDYLDSEELELSALLKRTNVENLSVLPAGSRHEHVAELWASTGMRRLLSEMAGRYADRIVIFDSPPLLQESSAHVLAGLMGQVLLVVEAEKTPQHVVADAMAMLQDQSKVGVILNKSNLRAGGDYNYGYY